MRHRVEGRKLKRTASHRVALLRALATQLLRHKRIRTTEAKAKEARRFAEAIISRAKRAHLAETGSGTPDVHARRVVARDIKDTAVVRELFAEIAPKVAQRNGGYTRVVKLGSRLGDGARMAILELVDYNVERDENAARSRTRATMSRAERVARSRAKQVAKEAPVEQAVEEAEIVGGTSSADVIDAVETVDGSDARTVVDAQVAEATGAVEGPEIAPGESTSDHATQSPGDDVKGQENQS